MTLAAGTRLGPYEIVAPLGAGGMGEVYRAKDTRLGREVAVKVLPRHLSANPEVRARFEREAKTVSGLNHPHICTLYDVGREGDADYLVMELIEGETLAQRLSRGPLPAADVLRLGGQIADALDRAHRAGVVHRDLKPGNVMLTKSGAKLMDFGLARATGLAPGSSGSGLSGLTQSPTMAAPLTAEGTIVGTFQYMAPEQLEGKEVDARGDLWALGCVLHEMATGRRAFEGASQASLIAAIMHVSPPPVSQVAPLAPPALDRVVAACLAKDPADRIQSAHDVKLQLGWLAEPGSVSGAAPAVPRARSAGASARLAFAVGALGLAAAAAAGWALFARRPETVVAQLVMPRALRAAEFWTGAAISPDGRRVVAAASESGSGLKLWLWNLDATAPVPLAAGEFVMSPSWAPDGRSVAYVSIANKSLNRIAIAGGDPTRLADVSDQRGVSWGSRDWIVYAPAPSGPLMKIRAGGGTPAPATALDAKRGEAGHRFPCFLPDGEHFLFTAMPRGPNGFTIRVGSLGSPDSKVVLETGSGAAWVAPGYLVFVERGKLLAQRFDLRGLRVTGEKFTLDDAPIYGDYDGEPPATGSRTGTLLYLANRNPDARLEWLDRSGATRATVPLPDGDWFVHSLSPDQRSALAAKGSDLWQVDLERGVPTRLLEDVDPTEEAQWSPDGNRIVATNREAGHEVLRLLNSGGSGARDSVPAPGALFLDAQGWAADGRSLLVAALGELANGADQSRSWNLWTVPLDGGEPRPYAGTSAMERFASLSPDGRWAAVQSRELGKVDLWVDSYPVPGHRLQVFTGERGVRLDVLWGRGGRELLYSTATGDFLSLPLVPAGDGLRAGAATKLFTLPAGIFSIQTRDGERFLVSRQDASAPGPSQRLVFHWTGLLKR